MNKFRLNGQHRSKLVTFAQSRIKPSKDVQLNIDELRVKMLLLFHRELNERYTASVLRVLGDFGLLTSTKKIKVNFLPSEHDSFNQSVRIQLEAAVRVVISNPNNCLSELCVANNGDFFKAYKRFNNAKYEQSKTYDETLSDYISLIATSMYFEDVAEVWKEVNEIKKELFESINCFDNAITDNLPNGCVERIREAVKLRNM